MQTTIDNSDLAVISSPPSSAMPTNIPQPEFRLRPSCSQRLPLSLAPPSMLTTSLTGLRGDRDAFVKVEKSQMAKTAQFIEELNSTVRFVSLSIFRFPAVLTLRRGNNTTKSGNQPG